MLEPNLVRKEMVALQRHFRDKRDYVIKRLRDMGFVIKWVPDATFYVWIDLEGLAGPISDGLNFFQACLEEKVIVVPGIFFDLNPARRRDLFDSPCHHFVRLSYGPKMETLMKGCDGIERVVNKYGSTPPRASCDVHWLTGLVVPQGSSKRARSSWLLAFLRRKKLSWTTPMMTRDGPHERHVVITRFSSSPSAVLS